MSLSSSSNGRFNNDEENPLLPPPPVSTDPAVATATRPLLQDPKERYDSTEDPGIGLLTYAYLIEPDHGLRQTTVHEALHRPDDLQQHAWIDVILYDDDEGQSSFKDLQRLIFD
jgi:hypothetical protein